jgi:hypothetical protein
MIIKNGRLRRIVQKHNEINTMLGTNLKFEKLVFLVGEKKGIANGNLYGKEFVALVKKLANNYISIAQAAEELSDETGKGFTADRINNILDKLSYATYNASWYENTVEFSHKEILNDKKSRQTRKLNDMIRKYAEKYGIDDIKDMISEYEEVQLNKEA